MHPTLGIGILGIMAFGLCHCQKPSTATIKQRDEPHHVMLQGIVAGNDRIITVSGTSHRQTLSCYRRRESGWSLCSAVELSRLVTGGEATELVFPENFHFCEQTFREGDTTFTIVTGYLQRKSLLFQRMRCDQPGSLSVRATLTPHHLAEMRSLYQHGESVSQLWLLPFEAETELRDEALVIEGEGELLMLWQFQDDQGTAAASWQSVLREFDPEATDHLDLQVVADRLHAEAARQSSGQK